MQRLMKRTISLVIASAAVAMALVSCTKEITVNKEAEKGINTDGTRTLTISIAANATKTDLSSDRKTPVWAEGDQISLNGVTYNVPSEAIGQTNFTLTTTETGAITAVYPAAAYQSTEPYFKVSDEQDGSFGCANICVAEAAAGVNTLTFQNVTAVFAVAVPSGTTKLTVTSLGKIDATGQRGTDAADTVAISTTKTGAAANVIIVEKEDKSAFGDSVYVAVAVDPDNGVLLTDLNFDTGSAQGGVSPNYIKSKGKDPLEYKAVAGYIYTPVLHEYVVVDGKKWATMNVGATEANPNGLYFAWGATEVAYESLTNNVFTFKTGKPASYVYSNGYTGPWTPGNGFADCNTPYFDNNFYSTSKYKDASSATLELSDDAANVQWGGSWRMPTKAEFDALASETKVWDSTNKGYTFGTSPNTIFLPAAGYGYGTDLYDVGDDGYYWSSSLNTDVPSLAFYLFFVDGSAYTDGFDRYCGLSVRAVSE